MPPCQDKKKADSEKLWMSVFTFQYRFNYPVRERLSRLYHDAGVSINRFDLNFLPAEKLLDSEIEMKYVLCIA